MTTPKEKGVFGEQTAQFKLERALAGHASRQQGSADEGIDLTYHFGGLLPSTSRIYFSAQIKCGHSYVKDEGNRWKIIKLNPTRFKEWQRANIPVIFIWVDDKNGESYWAKITKKTRIKDFTISKHAKISPVMAVDLSLYFAKVPHSTKSFKFEPLISPLSVGLRSFAKQYYRHRIIRQKFHNPHIGNVCVSWSGWRHMTRKDRHQKFIWQSLSLLPMVKCAVERPNAFVGLRRLSCITRGSWVTETRLIIFDSIGQDPKLKVQRKVRVVVRERIAYRKNWINMVDSLSAMKRELYLESIYEKPLN